MKRESKEVLYRGATDKRRKRSQLQLCDLPMNILTSIISRLPLKDAIRTSALSSKWRYVWCDHTDQLTFSCFTLRRRCSDKSSVHRYKIFSEGEFTTTVDAILQQHSGVGVERMQVKHALHHKHSAHLDKWIKFAIASKTRELTLDLSDKTMPMMFRDVPYRFERTEELYSFPCRFFDAGNGSCLRFLALASVSLKPPPAAGFACFRNLRELTLVDVDVMDEDVESLLSCHCKLLELLEIAFCGLLTAIRAPRPLKQLKHLRVVGCGFLEKVEMNCCSSLALLEYIGPMVPLVFGAASSLKNVFIRFMTFDTALDYIITGFPSTLPHLEMLSLHCIERERAAWPQRPLKFTHLRHLKLELIVFEPRGRKTDVLDYAHLLEVAPFLEILELHMWMDCPHQPYDRQKDSKLRSRLLLHQHGHLKWVHITGFFGHKDQVELALHILRASAMLRKMIINPQVKIRPDGDDVPTSDYKKRNYVDGCMIATEFVRDTGHGDVVEVVGASRIAPKPNTS